MLQSKIAAEGCGSKIAISCRYSQLVSGKGDISERVSSIAGGQHAKNFTHCSALVRRRCAPSSYFKTSKYLSLPFAYIIKVLV